MQLYASGAIAFTAAVAIGDYQMKWWKISPFTHHGILPGFVYIAYQASDPSKNLSLLSSFSPTGNHGNQADLILPWTKNRGMAQRQGPYQLQWANPFLCQEYSHNTAYRKKWRLCLIIAATWLYYYPNLRYHLRIFFDMLLASVYSLSSHQACPATGEQYLD